MKKLTLSIIIVFAGSINLKSQTKENSTKFTFTNVNNGIVYYEDQLQFKKEGVYILSLSFNNSIYRIDKKEPIALKVNNKLYEDNKHLEYDQFAVSKYNDIEHPYNPLKQEPSLYEIGISNVVWDSTHIVEDINNKGIMIVAPIRSSTPIIIESKEDLNKVYQLHIPAGVFTDVKGNKNEEIDITYKRKTK